MLFAEVKTGLDSLASTIVAQHQLSAAAKVSLESTLGTLNSLPTMYGKTITAIDDLAGDDLLDAGIQARKAEKDLMVIDYLALKAEVEAGIAAL